MTFSDNHQLDILEVVKVREYGAMSSRTVSRDF